MLAQRVTKGIRIPLLSPHPACHGQLEFGISCEMQQKEIPMPKKAPARPMPPDQPLVDTVLYGAGKDDSISDVTENAAITQHSLSINGANIPYTARAGHLVIADLYSARPLAKI